MRLPEDVWTAAVSKAAAEGTTVTAVVLAALTDYTAPTNGEAPTMTTRASRFIARHGLAAYRREYRNGWAAADRPGDSAKWESGNSSDAWDDGYLDRAAGRERWHLTNCPDHDTCGPS